jgi:hypothetical protein
MSEGSPAKVNMRHAHPFCAGEQHLCLGHPGEQERMKLWRSLLAKTCVELNVSSGAVLERLVDWTRLVRCCAVMVLGNLMRARVAEGGRLRISAV